MPEPQYLAGQDQDLYTIRQMGSNLSDAVIGMAEARSKRAELIRQMMLDNANLRLQQQKQQVEVPLIQAQTADAQARTVKTGEDTKEEQYGFDQAKKGAQMTQVANMPQDQMAQSWQQDPTAKAAVLNALNSSGISVKDVTPQQAHVLAGVAAKAVAAYQALMGNASAASLLKQPSAPNAVYNNPLTGEQVQNPPPQMNPFQGAELARQQASDKTKYNLQAEALKYKMAHPPGAPNPFAAALQRQMGQTQGTQQTGDQGFDLYLDPDGNQVKIPKGTAPPDGYTPVSQ